MSIKSKIESELKSLVGFQSAQPKTVALSAGSGVDVSIDLTAVDSMSCSLREIRLDVPALDGADFGKLKQWASDLSQRVTYLLENIGPLEFDEASGQVLIRSDPPDKSDATTMFYEILLQSHQDGNFSLRRYTSNAGQQGRTQVDIQTTHEVLQKLVTDLVETVPAA